MIYLADLTQSEIPFSYLAQVNQQVFFSGIRCIAKQRENRRLNKLWTDVVAEVVSARHRQKTCQIAWLGLQQVHQTLVELEPCPTLLVDAAQRIRVAVETAGCELGHLATLLLLLERARAPHHFVDRNRVPQEESNLDIQ